MDAKQFYFDMLKAFIDTMQASLDAARCVLAPLNDLVDNHELMDNPILNSENMIVKTEEPIEAPNPSMEAPKEILEPPKEYPFYKAAPPLVRCKEYDEDSKRVRRQLLTPSFLERLPTFVGVDLDTVEERMEWQRACETFRFTGEKKKGETLHDLSEFVYFVWLWHKEDRIKIHILCSELSKRISMLIDALNENWEKKKEEHDYESDEDVNLDEEEDDDELEDITDDSEEEEEEEDGDDEYEATPLCKKPKHEQ